ncbi:helix-turn-helix domain-containing protein [Halegenticoccus tardaugens]|uniref:helix-turn-helix domain-containing protein n=1 Tax=Halegenticoccus tardaugens TaxID=2071624 RepID=UPI00100AB664|nr:helix-turn-helix domain-containing protein [Halegenticoccus tardaugens]
MGITADFYLEAPSTREVLASVPEMKLEVEQFTTTGTGNVCMFLWAWGGDFGRFESEIGRSETVADPMVIADLPDRRLYRIELAESDSMPTTYPIWGELGLVLTSAVRSGDGWDVQMRFPDRDSLTRYADFCRENDFTFQLRRVLSTDRTDASRGLSECQLQTLKLAYEEGYYAVPREISQDELAEQLGVSGQAVSERLRRATAVLIRETVC